VTILFFLLLSLRYAKNGEAMVDATLRDEIDRQRTDRSPADFSPNLASLYEERRGRGRKRHLAVALTLTAAVVIVAAILDLINVPAQFVQMLPLRMAVIIILIGGAVAVLRLPPGKWEAAAFGLPLAGQAVLGAWVGAAAPPYLLDRNILAFLILFGVLCSVPPIPPRLSRVLAMLWFCSFVVTLWAAEGMQKLLHNLIALAVGAIALAVGACLAGYRERSRRRDFVQTLHSELTSVELRRLNGELERLMNTDVLTGVANRRRFDSDMGKVWQARAGSVRQRGIGLIMADVDHFKAFNDCAGHAEGDACLRAIAAAIGDVVRSGSFDVARWGGEEFVVLAPEIAQQDMDSLAERVRSTVEGLSIPHPAAPGGFVTVSVGWAWCGADEACETPDTLLRNADHALYAAKSAGRNRVVMAADTLAPPLLESAIG